MNTTITQLAAIHKIEVHVSAPYVGHHQVRRDIVPFTKLPHIFYSHSNKFFGQPDDDLHGGSKHVVLPYMLLLTVILLCS